MRATDEIVFNLLNDHAMVDLFGTSQELKEIRSQIDELGDFDKLQKRYDKIISRISWLRTARDTTITIIHEDNSETIMNRLAYERQKGNITPQDEQMIKFAHLEK